MNGSCDQAEFMFVIMESNRRKALQQEKKVSKEITHAVESTSFLSFHTLCMSQPFNIFAKYSSGAVFTQIMPYIRNTQKRFLLVFCYFSDENLN